MDQDRTAGRDPVRDTVVRLEQSGCGVSVDAIVAAWREALFAELELRVGTRLAAACSTAQLAQFESLLDAGDDAGCDRWLAVQVPEHRVMVAEEMNALVEETVAWFVRTATLTEVAR